jgi:murein DD-endopeptidase MepM/ murein hydrolase activator NlpD
MLISSVFASCSNIASGIGSAVAGVSYQAEDADIDNAELAYTEWETDLQIEIASTETDYPGYDEYRYYVGDISHNPYELMAYLTAKFQNFTYPNIEAELQSLFAEQYTLTYTPSVEVRYADPDDSDEDGDYEAYDWNVLTVSLTARSFTDVVHSRLDTEQRQHYDALMRTKGARQYVENPLDFGWLPYVSSGYGYRVHPISGAKNYHKGIDIAIPVGTELHAGFDGTVTIGYDAGGYGNYVTLTSADGLVANYAHLDSVLVSDGQAVVSGDIIALSGNSGNSTGPHLHLEVIKNAVYLNPSYFVDTGSYSLSPIYGDPGMPMGDGK